MNALFNVTYALASYFAFLVIILYTIAFVSGLPVPLAIDAGGPAASPGVAALIDLLLLATFGVQHSVMARAWFKRALMRIVPAELERSTYVLASTAALALIVWQWRPIADPVIWHAGGTTAVILQVVFWLGWATMLASSFFINHFELFGLQQVCYRLMSLDVPEPEFRTPLLYKYVRHPLYVGVLLGFWATPHMTAGHLLFAAGFTAYVLVGIHFEERDLVARFGERYRKYRRRVGMLLPTRLFPTHD